MEFSVSQSQSAVCDNTNSLSRGTAALGLDRLYCNSVGVGTEGPTPLLHSQVQILNYFLYKS